MAVLLVRHAVALARHKWPGSDELRPLTRRGERQAAALVGQLAPFAVARVLSSPFLRCVESVAPLATARHLEVEDAAELAEGAGPRAVELVHAVLADDVVLCTHGDVIPEILEALRAAGMAMRCQKGSTWILEPDGASAIQARYLAPPA